MCDALRLAASIVALLAASQNAAAKRRRHRWGIKVRPGSYLSITTCEKCGLVMYSRHSVDPDGVIDHWKVYYTADHPDVEIRRMPECEC